MSQSSFLSRRRPPAERPDTLLPMNASMPEVQAAQRYGYSDAWHNEDGSINSMMDGATGQRVGFKNNQSPRQLGTSAEAAPLVTSTGGPVSDAALRLAKPTGAQAALDRAPGNGSTPDATTGTGRSGTVPTTPAATAPTGQPESIATAGFPAGYPSLGGSAPATPAVAGKSIASQLGTDGPTATRPPTTAEFNAAPIGKVGAAYNRAPAEGPAAPGTTALANGGFVTFGVADQNAPADGGTGISRNGVPMVKNGQGSFVPAAGPPAKFAATARDVSATAGLPTGAAPSVAATAVDTPTAPRPATPTPIIAQTPTLPDPGLPPNTGFGSNTANTRNPNFPSALPPGTGAAVTPLTPRFSLATGAPAAPNPSVDPYSQGLPTGSAMVPKESTAFNTMVKADDLKTPSSVLTAARGASAPTSSAPVANVPSPEDVALGRATPPGASGNLDAPSSPSIASQLSKPATTAASTGAGNTSFDSTNPLASPTRLNLAGFNNPAAGGGPGTPPAPVVDPDELKRRQAAAGASTQS